MKYSSLSVSKLALFFVFSLAVILIPSSLQTRAVAESGSSEDETENQLEESRKRDYRVYLDELYLISDEHLIRDRQNGWSDYHNLNISHVIFDGIVRIANKRMISLLVRPTRPTTELTVSETENTFPERLKEGRHTITSVTSNQVFKEGVRTGNSSINITAEIDVDQYHRVEGLTSYDLLDDQNSTYTNSRTGVRYNRNTRLALNCSYHSPNQKKRCEKTYQSGYAAWDPSGQHSTSVTVNNFVVVEWNRHGEIIFSSEDVHTDQGNITRNRIWREADGMPRPGWVSDWHFSSLVPDSVDEIGAAHPIIPTEDEIA